MELYLLKKDQCQYYGVIEYFDYNVPIVKEMFSLSSETLNDTHIINSKTQNIGLPQGDLSDEEIAIKVTKDFLGALIVKDYIKARLILGGIHPDKLKKGWGQLKITNLISVGKPFQPDKLSKIYPRKLIVPYTIEFEKDGQIIQQQQQFFVNTVLGKRQNWQMGGKKD
jgi:hypothetical protein